MKINLLLCAVMAWDCSSASSKKPIGNGPVTIEMQTTMGDVEIELYAQTPKHRDNFVKLVNEGFYNGVLFHRVIKDFMIQAGDPDSKKAKAGVRLGSGGPGYTVPAEFVPELFHKRGALSAARQGDQVNPQKASSGSQFYIVVGKVYTDAELDQAEQQHTMMLAQPQFMKFVKAEQDSLKAAGATADMQAVQANAKKRTMAWVEQHPYKMPAERREAYKTVGGTPHLDDNYTVFGHVTKGLEVVEKIALVATDGSDRPKEDVRILKMKVK